MNEDKHTIELRESLKGDLLAMEIANKWIEWDNLRSSWKQEKQELRNYIFATDTTKTTNAQLPWKNKTTLPKICQIRDNLHANYLAALFPNDQWMRWEGYDKKSSDSGKGEVVRSYIATKLRDTGFRNTLSDLIYDYIDYGNAFAQVVYVKDITDEGKENQTISYIGPKVIKISPMDIVFDPTAASFEQTPKIVRSLKPYGWIKENVKSAQTRKEIISFRDKVRNVANISDVEKAIGYKIDGFGDWKSYLNSGYVEVLYFIGDIYDPENNTVLQNQEIAVVDRRYIAYKQTNPSWLGKHPIVHCGWRSRPDNIWGMGPLDNLVGMQYRIDHLENLRADVFDFIAYPILKVKGSVDDFEWKPKSNIYCEEDGDVVSLAPDVTVLQADNQISMYMNLMEEMAGAPKQAMGIRTPGEKTAFEVQALENAAGRIFQDKTTQFEINLIEPLLNLMLEAGRRNLDTNDVLRVLDDDLAITKFIQITKDDLTVRGKLRPVGARHFSERAQLVQNLAGIYNTKIGDLVTMHTSGWELTQLLENLFNMERYKLFRKNAQVFEQKESQQLINAARDEIEEEDAIIPNETGESNE